MAPFKPQYTPKQLPYISFLRSTDPTSFAEYEKDDVTICWIDLLGVSGMNHASIVQAVTTCLESASESSSNGGIWDDGVLVGTTNAAMQFSLVGDALLLVEKHMPKTPAAATLALIYRVNILARLLNERGLLFRGVITKGTVKCFTFEGSTLITGEAVVRASSLEKNLKASGLYYDEKIAQFISSRAPQVFKDSFCVNFSQVPNWPNATHAPGLYGVCFSQFDGWKHWNENLNRADGTNNKVINAKSLLIEIKSTIGI